jgi:hypothetical protein
MNKPDLIIGSLRLTLSRLLGSLLLAGSLGLSAQGQSERPATPDRGGEAPGATPARKTAVFVQNRAAKVFDAKVEVLEDFITTRVVGEGFALITRDAATRGLRDHTPGGRGWPGLLDKELESSTSALRLAHNLGADYILVATIATYGKNQRSYDGNGISTSNILHTLRVTTRIVDASHGGAIRGRPANR